MRNLAEGRYIDSSTVQKLSDEAKALFTQARNNGTEVSVDKVAKLVEGKEQKLGMENTGPRARKSYFH